MDKREGDERSEAAATHGRGRRSIYQIRVTGHLEPRWADWFDGLSVSQQADGTTVIEGPVADQAALHGLLQQVRDLSLELVAVTRLARGQQ